MKRSKSEQIMTKMIKIYNEKCKEKIEIYSKINEKVKVKINGNAFNCSIIYLFIYPHV